MKKWTKRLLIVSLSVIALIFTLVGGIRAYFRLPVSAYYGASEKAFLIPEINSGFVPQGFCYDKDNDCFLASGYSSKDEPSSIYIIDNKSGEAIKSVKLLKENGKPFTGHAGGVAQFKDWVYVAGSSSHCLFVYSYKDILAEGITEVKCIGEFSLKTAGDDYVKASFVFAGGGKLVVGEFHYIPKYNTQASHKVTLPDGKTYGGIAVEFNLTESAEFGISSDPNLVYSLPDKVQGMHFEGDRVFLSVSHGLNHSYIYEYSKNQLPIVEYKNILNKDLNVYAFTDEVLKKEYKLPPMAEEIAFVDGKLVVLSEFACNKYILGKLTGAKWVYRTDVSKI